MGKLHYFLGMKILQNEKSGEVWIGQPAYTENLLEKFGMSESKPVSTPVDPSVMLVKATEDDHCFDLPTIVSVSYWKSPVFIRRNQARYHILRECYVKVLG